MIDPAELGRYFDRHAPAMILLARQWCVTPEDVVQEAFIKLALQSPVPAHPTAWLFTVVRRGAISAGRSKRRRTRHEGQQHQIKPCWFEQDASTTLDAEQATKALDHLSIKEREVVLAHLWGGLTFEEIGSMLGTTTTSAHRLYHQALQKLRLTLGEVHVP